MKIYTLLITTVTIAFANAQEKGADPFVVKVGSSPAPATISPSNPPEDEESSGPVNLSLCYEDFSLPLAQAAALQREGLPGAQLYAKVIAAVGKDSVRQETFCVLTTKSGQKSNNDNVSELIYPTEFEEPQLSNAVTTGITGNDKDGKATPAGPLPVSGPVAIARTPATPSAFETRNLGFTFEIEPTSIDQQHIDLRTVVEHVDFAGRSAWGQEFSTVEMPNFEAQRMNIAVMLKVGEPFCIGTINRPPVSTLDPDSANRVWFAFITAKLAK
jgi:hypothetical protein